MPVDYRVRIIRFWLALALLGLLTVLWPDGGLFAWSILPLGILPCPACCPASCDILNDPFTTDQLATEWDQRAGSWTVSSGTLNIASASALIVTVDELPVGMTGAYVTALITCASTSDVGRLILAYVDDNNYWFCEVKPGATDGTLKLYQRSGGVDTQRGTTQTMPGFTAGETATVCMGVGYGFINARAYEGSNTPVTATYQTTPTTAQTQGGCGTGSGSSDVKFDNFIFGKAKVDDVNCYYCQLGPHSCCQDHVIPARMQVVITNIADNLCTDCDTTFNATFILSHGPNVACGASADSQVNCVFAYDDTGTGFCGSSATNVQLSGAAGLWDLQCSGRSGTNCAVVGGFHITESSVTTPCDEFSGLVMNDTFTVSGSACSNGGGAQAAITSLP